MDQPYELASAYKMKGDIYASMRDFATAESFFFYSKNQLIKDYLQMIMVKLPEIIMILAISISDSLNDLAKAKKYYLKGIGYALRDHDSVRLCRIQVNLGEMNSMRHDYENASLNNIKAFRYLKVNVGNNILLNPPAARLNSIGNKELIITLMRKKTELLLPLFKKPTIKII